MIKPNAVESADDIVAQAEAAGLVVCGRVEKQLTEDDAKAFYAHDGKSFFSDLTHS